MRTIRFNFYQVQRPPQKLRPDSSSYFFSKQIVPAYNKLRVLNCLQQEDNNFHRQNVVNAVTENSLEEKLKVLQNLLGYDSEQQIVQMIDREPDLLNMDYNYLIGRLVNMRQLLKQDVSLLDIIERQPSLLTQQPEVTLIGEWDQDEMLRSWKLGVFDDRDQQWQYRFEELQLYNAQIGDLHVGFRDSDPILLVRWANKQRNDYKSQKMKEQRLQSLQMLGFEFDAEAAEWNCWFNELRINNGRTHLGSEVDMKITNWCSVQRVARKCSVLQQDRVNMLNSIGFDWAAADALS